MRKEEFTALGISEELAAKAEAASRKELEGYVPKAKLEEAGEESKALKKAVADRDKQLDALKTASGDNEELKKQIEAMKQQNAEQEKAHRAELARLRLDNAVDAALAAAGARNGKAVKPLLDLSQVKLGEDGKLAGLDEQLKEVKKSDGYLFTEVKQARFQGFRPGEGSVKLGDAPDFSKMSYAELAGYLAENPDTEIS
ncbi:MAG: hypothetical protein HFJ86_03265 [Oscillospiraceae bacterium]|jgi:hypothetical protein|nr:hypothetical protein [Oscillospiraceae bacterium]